MELAHALDADIDPVQPLPVPETLEELVRARISGLPASTREALALAAAFGTTSETLLERAGVAPEALDAAVVAHVIERENGTIRFAHPLLSSVLYQDLGEERRQVHRRIAGIVEDPLLHARHLALGTETPAADVARCSTTPPGWRPIAAPRPSRPSSPSRHSGLTPPGDRDERHLRALAAARAHHAAGEWTRARAIASDLLAEADVGSLRAEALVLLAEFESVDRAVELLRRPCARPYSPGAPGGIRCRLAWATRFREGFVAALDPPAALELADELDDDMLRGIALNCTPCSTASPATWSAGGRRASAGNSRPRSATSSS